MKLCFLGTGAADWQGPNEIGEYRRLTSTLVDGKMLMDVTMTVLDQISDPAAITDVFFTHSHKDHFDLDALRKLAPCRVYAHKSWAGMINGDGLEVVALQVGIPVETVCGYTVIPLPANHSTDNKEETTLHYLIEGEGKRVLYATDGAWLLNQAHHIIGKKVLDAAVFDATIGDGFDGDYRIFEHNSIDMVRLMVRTMQKTGRLPEGAPVYLTHMARTLHASQEEVEGRLEKPFIACYDGFVAEV
jgi:L-ascorbate metabolism protein UlaG (beta-lactamase superfamily)